MALLAAILCSFAASAVEPTSAPPAPRRKLTLDNELDRPPSADWRTGKGTWTVHDGGWKGVEIAAEGHAASARRNLAFRDAVIQCEVRLDGARFAILKLNGTKGHCLQVMLSPDGVRMQRYTVEAEAKRWTDLAVLRTPLAAGTWHAVTLELRGREAVATIEGMATPSGPTKLHGEHATLDVDKTTLILNVVGDSASFRNLRLLETSD